MDNKTIKGIVEDVNAGWKSVTISGKRYSGKFTYKGNLPNKGDEVELILVSSIGKDTKTYWNIVDIRVLKASSGFAEARESKSTDMILSYAKDLVIAGKADTLDSAVKALMAARKILTEPEKELNDQEEY